MCCSSIVLSFRLYCTLSIMWVNGLLIAPEGTCSQKFPNDVLSSLDSLSSILLFLCIAIFHLLSTFALVFIRCFNDFMDRQAGKGTERGDLY